MSRRQHTTLTFTVQVSIPAGWTQAKFLEHFIAAVTQAIGSCIIKLTDKKITYL